MARSSFIGIVGTLIGIAAVVGCITLLVQRHRETYRNAIVATSTSSEQRADGRHTELRVGENEGDEIRFVLVYDSSATVESKNDSDARARLATLRFLMGPLSDVGYVSAYPADPDQSGLWVDGLKIDMGTSICVVYVSDMYRATRIEIAPSEEEEFVAAVRHVGRTNEALDFVDEWIIPRLPPEPSPGKILEKIIKETFDTPQQDGERMDVEREGDEVHDAKLPDDLRGGATRSNGDVRLTLMYT